MPCACPEPDTSKLIFCPHCNKVKDLSHLKKVRMPGFVGVENSTNPTIERFWQTGDPTVFSRPS